MRNNSHSHLPFKMFLDGKVQEEVEKESLDVSRTPDGSNDWPCLTDLLLHSGKKGAISLPSSNSDLQLGN